MVGLSLKCFSCFLHRRCCTPLPYTCSAACCHLPLSAHDTYHLQLDSWQEYDQRQVIPDAFKEDYTQWSFPQLGNCSKYGVAHQYVQRHMPSVMIRTACAHVRTCLHVLARVCADVCAWMCVNACLSALGVSVSVSVPPCSDILATSSTPMKTPKVISSSTISKTTGTTPLSLTMAAV